MAMKRRVILAIVVVVLAGGYTSSWFFLQQLGLVRPMANTAYFYYGKSHAKPDSALYVTYFPLCWYEMRTKGHSRYGIHWSDRKEMSFTDEELKNAPEALNSA